MGVTVSRNFGPLSNVQLLTKDDWARVGRLARERILRRTAAGRDVDGRPFQAYSDGYAEQKQKAVGMTSGVNLQVSGEMLRAIVVEADAEGVTLKFSS